MKLNELLTNISGIAAIAIIVVAVGGVFIALIGSTLGRPLASDAFELVRTFVNVLIGLAVGAGAGGSALAVRAVRAMEMSAYNNKE